MVLLTTTPQILQAVSFLSSSSSTIDTTTLDLPKSPSDPISHTTLITISRYLRSHPSTSSQPCTLSTLLRGTSVYTPPPPPLTPKPASYIALRARLLAEQEARSYNALLSSSTNSLPIASSDEQVEDDISPSLVLNILLSTLLCGFAVWSVAYPIRNDGLRVLMGLAAAAVVAIAECGLYAAYLNKVKDAKKKERAKRERKGVVREVTGTGYGVEEVKKKEEGEEIWGHGINGGVRRRVREKYEKEKNSET